MKKLLSLFACAAIMISFAACSGSDNNDPTPEKDGITIKIQALSTRAHMLVTASDPDKDFIFDYVGLMGEYAQFNDPKELAEYYLANAYDGDWHESSMIHKAKYEETPNVSPDTRYIAFAFYIDAASNIVGEVYSYFFQSMPTSTLNGEFSVSETKKVHFGKANVYTMGGEDYYFFQNQWDCISSVTPSYADLVTWEQATNAFPPTKNFFLLSAPEWEYLFKTRPGAATLFAHATIGEIKGLILLPDKWETPEGINLKNASEIGFEWDEQFEAYLAPSVGYAKNVFNEEEWATMEYAGAVFLPAAGDYDKELEDAGKNGLYWTSTATEDKDKVYYIMFGPQKLYPKNAYTPFSCAVRPVRIVE